MNIFHNLKRAYNPEFNLDMILSIFVSNFSELYSAIPKHFISSTFLIDTWPNCMSVWIDFGFAVCGDSELVSIKLDKISFACVT